MLAAIGFVLALCVNGLSDFAVDIGKYTLAGLSYTPVLLLFTALYLVLFGLLPRTAAGVTWLYFGFVAFALWLGPIVQLDQSVMNLSVMEYLAAPPAEDILWKPLVMIGATALGLIILGVIAFRRRDIG